MTFKLGSEKRDKTDFKLRFKRDDASVPGTPVIRKELEGGILGEANNDGSIFIDVSVPEGSDKEKEIGGDSTKWDASVIAYNKVRTDNPK